MGRRRDDVALHVLGMLVMTDPRHPYARQMLEAAIESLEDDMRQLSIAIEVAEEHVRSLRLRRLNATCDLIRARRDLDRLSPRRLAS